MQYVDYLVAGFVLLHGVAFIFVMIWIGRFLTVRNALGENYEEAKRKERKARIPAIILVAVLVACYAALFILEGTMK
ncbi:MAG: hypothetical protein J5789_08460 [Oscillospiraceae bacterium]|nr:hypothetical protein [Oscillospiraceae bacterium]